jgi:hypothetical protein
MQVLVDVVHLHNRHIFIGVCVMVIARKITNLPVTIFELCLDDEEFKRGH